MDYVEQDEETSKYRLTFKIVELSSRMSDGKIKELREYVLDIKKEGDSQLNR